MNITLMTFAKNLEVGDKIKIGDNYFFKISGIERVDDFLILTERTREITYKLNEVVAKIVAV